VTVLSMERVRVRVGSGRGALIAVDGIDLDVPAGSVVGLVGESGSGKSTLARAVVGLVRPLEGRILLDGRDFAGARGARLRELRRRVQLVFQDPRASLNPRMTVGDALAEALTRHRRMDRRARRAEIARLLDQVALEPRHAGERPAALSGGQRQRVALARALAVQPDVIVADEVTASLDASVQGSVLNLLRDLQAQTGLTLVVISHNLAIVRYLSDHIAVMHLGRIVERGTAAAVLADPQHPYTRTLIESISLDDLGRAPAQEEGQPPDPQHPPAGCRFHPLCPIGPRAHPDRTVCTERDPVAVASERAHRAACHFAAVNGAGSDR
jgi:peptide/nickel transport system ATP-binding protein